jgi:dihydrofolate synthase/folylpolyglutamate synthase
VIGHQIDDAIQAGVMNVFQKSSQDLSPAAALAREGAEWSCAPESGQMLFRYGNDSILTRRPVLLGNHQYWNAGAALAAFKIIAPDHFTPEILSTGLATVDWPGRLQTLENRALLSWLAEGSEIVIDGGHNDSAGLVLAEQMREWAAADARPLHLILAMVNRKDPAAFLKPLLPYVLSVTAVEIEGEATTYRKEVLADVARTLGFHNVAVANSVKDAMTAIGEREKNKSRVLMTGSLFFMGNILAGDA